MALRLMRTLPGDRLSCPRDPRIIITAGVASASRCQDHTFSTCASCRSSARHKPCCGPRRPPHPIPRVMTIAIRPSCRGGTGGENHTFLINGSKKFFAIGPDRVSRIEMTDEFRVSARPLGPGYALATLPGHDGCRWRASSLAPDRQRPAPGSDHHRQ
jgi:hypothetical protein